MPAVVSLATLFVAGFVIFLLWLIIDRFRRLQARATANVPGPPANLLAGNLPLMGQIMQKNGGLLYNVFEQLRAEYGPRYGIHMGPSLFIINENLDDIKDILVRKFDHFQDRQEMNFLPKSLKLALVNLKGDVWKTSRTHQSPCFSTSKIRAMSSVVHAQTEQFFKVLDEDSLNNNCFDIYSALKRLTLSVFASTAFGIEDSGGVENDLFLKHANNFFAKMPSPEKNIFMAISLILPEVAPICEYLDNLISDGPRSEDFLISLLGKALDERLKKPVERRQDILQILLESGMDRAQIIHNAFAFLLAGYETTSTSLAFACWLLAKHQDKQEKLFEELENLPEPQNIDEYYSEVMRLPFLNCVFKETLRLFPPITFFVNRTCVKPCVIRGIRYEKGVQVGVPIWNLHRNEELWQDANEFVPERFLQPYEQFAWLPFGAGPRHCIGLRFAEMEFKIVLARLISTRRVALCSRSQDPLPLTNGTAMLSTPEITLRSERRCI